MEAILDPSQDIDVSLLDRVVATFFSGGPEQKHAQEVLAKFQEQDDSWQRVPAILSQSQSEQCKYIALQILEKLITTRWKVLPPEQRFGVRNFTVSEIVRVAQDESTLRREKSYLSKLNLVLVQILKQDWPHNFPDFIPEIVSSSTSSFSLCENNMIILKLLSEEIFDFSAEQMTTSKTRNLKNSMCDEFAQVFELCVKVLQEATKPSLIKATLETFLRFLSWVPLGYIFETNIIDILVSRFLEVPDFRNVTLKCLSEVAVLNVSSDYDPKFVILFTMVMTSINRIIPPTTNFPVAYEEAGSDGQELILNLALFLTNFLGNHLKLIETPEHRELLMNGHLYLVKISTVPEREVFKICLEYWSKLVSELYEEIQALPLADGISPLVALNLGGAFGAATGFGGAGGALDSLPLRRNIYGQILSNLRLVMIEKMVKPEEVLIVENEEGEIVRESLKETDTIVLYKSMREVLVYLTHLDVMDTENIMTEKLGRQVDDSEFSWSNLNTLCWAIGSISGAMNEEAEKRFLVTVIKELLGLTERKKGKDNKAVVASNIMYIVGQYPRFLKAHWRFLKTVVNKLFEFMHETHEGVQDMACDTFIKIAQKCRRHFVMQQQGETEPFIDEILRKLPQTTCDLSPQQVNVFYEAVGYMISAQPNRPTQERLISKLMETPNTAWDAIMQQAAHSVDVLSSTDNLKILSNILKTNVSACTSIGSFFLPQIARIYMDMLGLYKAVSGLINQSIASDPIIAPRTPKVRNLRSIKKEVLKLVDIHVRKAEDLPQLNSTLIPPLLEAVLGDYSQNIPAARDAEVLNVMATIISILGPLLTDKVGDILSAVFEVTLEMINKDFSDFPEHRVGFFKLLRAINLKCFPALLALEPLQFKMMMDSVVWAIKHTMRDIADIGLSICLELINNVANDSDEGVKAGFFQQYFLSLLQDIFFVLTDTDHKSGFKNQSAILARLFVLVESGGIAAPLFDPAVVNDPTMTNRTYVQQFCVNLLRNAFPHVQLAQIQTFVTGLAELNQDPVKFKLNLRDFLIELREFSGDNAELYLEEQEARKAEERQKALTVPGMVKPSEVVDADEEL